MTTTMNTNIDEKPRDAWAERPTLDSLKEHDIFEMRESFLTKLFPYVAGLNVVEVGSGERYSPCWYGVGGQIPASPSLVCGWH